MPEKKSINNLEREESKIPKIPALGIWVAGENGNSPVCIFDANYEKMAKQIAEMLWPNQHIVASIEVEKCELITRGALKDISAFGASLIPKLVEKLDKKVEA